MAEDNNDVENLTRNKSSYGPLDHLKHLLRIGYDYKSIVIKNFLNDNALNLSEKELLELSK